MNNERSLAKEITEGFEALKSMRNNEPVAWISVLGIDHIGQKFTDVRVSLTKTDVASIPLYTHPAETITLAELRKTELYRTEQTRSLREFLEPKELTDEEIFKTAIENGAYQNKESGHIYPDDMYILNFARAILRKAKRNEI